MNLNRRHVLLKELKGKYFTHIKNGHLYKVMGVVFCTDIDNWKIRYTEWMIDTRYVLNVGPTNFLRPNRVIEFTRKPLSFKNKMKPVESFNLAGVARIWDIHKGF